MYIGAGTFYGPVIMKERYVANMAKKETFCVRFTDAEKEWLMKQARNNDMSLNAYIRSKCLDKMDRSRLLLSGVEREEGDDEPVIRDQNVKVMLSMAELKYVKRLAGMMSVSAFIRKTILEMGNRKITFDIHGEDLSELGKILSDFNMRMEGIIGALRFRTELYHSDIASMERMLRDVNDNVKKCVTTVMTDRKYIRKRGIEHLKAQINKQILS